MKIRKPPVPEFAIQDFHTGQQRAFTYVFELHYAGLCFFAIRLVQNIHSAEDIVQEIFLKLWETRTRFESLQRIKAFLYISTRNACFNFLKRVQTGVKNHRLWSYTWTEEDHDYVLNLVTCSEVLNDIYLMIETLPRECRRIMRHSFIDGWSNQQIADKLNLSIHTVKNQKVRAVNLMKKKVAGRPLLLLAIILLECRGNPPKQVINDSIQEIAAIVDMPVPTANKAAAN